MRHDRDSSRGLDIALKHVEGDDDVVLKRALWFEIGKTYDQAGQYELAFDGAKVEELRNAVGAVAEFAWDLKIKTRGGCLAFVSPRCCNRTGRRSEPLLRSGSIGKNVGRIGAG